MAFLFPGQFLKSLNENHSSSSPFYPTRIQDMVQSARFCFSEIFITIDAGDKVNNPFDNAEALRTTQIFIDFNRTVYKMAQRAVSACKTFCSPSQSPPVLRVVLINTEMRLRIAHHAFGFNRTSKMWKNALMVLHAISEASSPYLF
eukprot:CAMPEP_0180672996 /NCGR_PEP_ID=MMETSP1037_2-20121125/65448_1 /TAXON_ID=632150 /ORGANISM="Azadinium spinosum, Strain 3D9" /LENGTH=145 /DNA_ID=CAMNT_0022702213 /DNA_START=74 /DNA_END=508 /DNA_ORIENTATION=+